MRTVDKARWPVLSPLLDELLDLDAAARAERLTLVRAGDPGLADDLSALLIRMGDLEGAAFLDAPALPPPRDLAGQTIGAYTLERELGRGGMGSVWLARRTDGRYQGQVAIKFLQAGLFGGGDAARFEREGSILARLDHPHIARLLDAGLTSDNAQPYLVLEYIAGEPIDRYCEQQGLGTRTKVRLFLDVLAAVSHAHNRLILHRDLKPSNILVNTAGQVKLLDFGIAKLLDDANQSAGAGEVTKQAGNAYTPQFAAPEQVQGGEVTTATDVYALGVLLYLLMAGQHPTVGATAAALDQMRAVVETEPRRLSDTVLRQGGDAAPRQARELRGDLDTIVARTLKKAPADRYANAADLADDLRRYLADEPIVARPDSFAYRAAKYLRRNRLAVAAGSVTTLAIVLGVGVALKEGREARRQQVQAEGLIEFMLGDLRKKLEPVGRLEVLDAVGGKALAYYAAQEGGRLDADSLGRRARALHLIGEMAEKRGQLAEAARSFGQAAEATAMLMAHSPESGQAVFDQAQSEYWVGFIAWRRGLAAEAEQAFMRYRLLAERLTRLDPANFDWRTELAYADQNLGVVYRDSGRPAEALKAFSATRDTWLAVVDKRPELGIELANTLGFIAGLREGAGQFEAAIEAQRAKIDALAKVPNPADNRKLFYLDANARNEIGNLHIALGQADLALPPARESVKQFASLVALDASNLDWLSQSCAARLTEAEAFEGLRRPDDARALLPVLTTDMARLLAAGESKVHWRVTLWARLLLLQARLVAPGSEAAALVDDMTDYLGQVHRHQSAGKTLNPTQARAAAAVALALGDRLAMQGQTAAARTHWKEGTDRLSALAGRGDIATLTLLAHGRLRLGEVQEARALLRKVEASSYRHPYYQDLNHRLAPGAEPGPGS